MCGNGHDSQWEIDLVYSSPMLWSTGPPRGTKIVRERVVDTEKHAWLPRAHACNVLREGAMVLKSSQFTTTHHPVYTNPDCLHILTPGPRRKFYILYMHCIYMIHAAKMQCRAIYLLEGTWGIEWPTSGMGGTCKWCIKSISTVYRLNLSGIGK